MDVNDLIKRPEQLAAFLSDLPYAAHTLDEAQTAALLAQADTLRQRQPELKQRLAEKKAIARQFRDATEETRAELKASMAQASQSLAALESDLKEQRQSLIEQLTALAQPPEADAIAQFKAWPDDAAQPFTGDIKITTWDDPLWADWCLRQPQRSQYHHPEMGTVIQNAMGHQGPVLLAVEESNVVGALPLVIQSSRLFGRFGTSVPYFNYGGPLTHSSAVARALIEAARPLLAEYELSHIEVRTTQPGLPYPCSSCQYLG